MNWSNTWLFKERQNPPTRSAFVNKELTVLFNHSVKCLLSTVHCLRWQIQGIQLQIEEGTFGSHGPYILVGGSIQPK